MDLKAISELKGYTFVIPYQQRGYRWTPDNVRILLKDLQEFISSDKKLYCLQPIAVVPKDDKDEKTKEVIDGQQRLTTLFLLWKFLGEQPYEFEFERDKNDERKEFMGEISSIEKEDDSNIDFFYISRAYLTIKKWFSTPDGEISNEEKDDFCKLEDKETVDDVIKKFKKLLNAPPDKQSIQILWYKVDEAEKHEAFRNINDGKIHLSNSDLIKALLLNKTNNIENRQQIAAQFEIMERRMSEDRFWYMLQQKDIEPLKGQSRIDLLFNMIAGVKSEEYQIDSRKSFFKFSNYSTNELFEMWQKVRRKYQRLRDLYEDPYTFHYVGFLTYCGMKLNDILGELEIISKSQYVEKLKESIKKKLAHESLGEYSYYDSKTDLRRLFVLHNIETLLFRYKELKKYRGLKFAYENFPFELLYNHNWNIEHIASHTDNNLKSETDRRDWIESVSADFPNLFKDDSAFSEIKTEVEKDLKNDAFFNDFYKQVVDKVNDNPITKEEDKNGIGNLVLLDEHTNKSFHNSLFPRKRRIVIMASGLRNKNDIENYVESVYVPICTQQVYTKSYNKQSNVSLNSWGQDDYQAYYSDMQEKLHYYFDTKQGD